MKNNNIILLILLMFFAASQNVSANEPVTEKINPHDSLLFDGETVPQSKYPFFGECAVWVFSVQGSVKGTVMHDTTGPIGCGIMGTVTEYEWKQVRTMDLLKPGDSIVTGPDGIVKITVGSVYGAPVFEDKEFDRFVIGANSTFFPVCPGYGQTLLKRGKLWRSEKAAAIEKKVIETYRSVIKPKGTIYSIEVTESEDIIRVYEGSVDIYLRELKDKKVDDSEKEFAKLTEDLGSGKITPEEFQNKIAEITGNLKTTVTVSEGYQCSVGEKIGEVVPVTGESKWWGE